MVANGVINGTGNNMFSPTVTASRQEALIIAVRMVEKLKGKTVDYTKGEVPAPTPAPTSSGNDTVSQNALVGSWNFINSVGRKDMPLWVFGADGTFAYYTYNEGKENLGGNNTMYERWVQGKYRVNGNVIEFYNCRVASYIKSYSGREYIDYIKEKNNGVMSDNMLLYTPLPETGSPYITSTTEHRNNYSAMFEFSDATHLRLVTEGDLLDTDADYEYDGSSRNVAVPTHRIPGLAWPKSELPSDVLEYGNGGRVRNVYKAKGDINIVIDNTTRNAVCDYAISLMQSGWSAMTRDAEEYVQEFRQGKYETYDEFFSKGSYNLHVTMRITGHVIIVFY